MKTFGQLWRVVVVNLTSAGVDYSSLFLLSLVTGIVAGNGIIPLNVLSFTGGTFVSYYFNKRWSFADHSRFDHHRKFALFLLVAVLAVAVNTLVVRLVTTEIPSWPGLTDRQWLLMAKIAASAFSFTVNFIGYKFVVFKK